MTILAIDENYMPPPTIYSSSLYFEKTCWRDKNGKSETPRRCSHTHVPRPRYLTRTHRACSYKSPRWLSRFIQKGDLFYWTRLWSQIADFETDKEKKNTLTPSMSLRWFLADYCFKFCVARTRMAARRSRDIVNSHARIISNRMFRELIRGSHLYHK